MRVNEQTLWNMKQFATRWLYLITFRCSSRPFSVMMPSPPKKAVELFALVCSRLDRRP